MPIDVTSCISWVTRRPHRHRIELTHAARSEFTQYAIALFREFLKSTLPVMSLLAPAGPATLEADGRAAYSRRARRTGRGRCSAQPCRLKDTARGTTMSLGAGRFLRLAAA